MTNNNWPIVSVSDVTDVWIGGTPSRNKPEYWDIHKESQNIWVSIRDLSNLKDRYISDSTEYISNEGVKKSNVKLIPKNTVMMSFKLSIGKMAISNKPLYTNEAIASFHIKDKRVLDPFYLYYVLPTLSYETDTAVKGDTLNKAKLNSSAIPLPKLQIQQKIGVILSAVDAVIDKTNKIIEEIEVLKKGIKRELLTQGIGHEKFKQSKLGNIPEKWDVVDLKDVAKIANGQVDPKIAPYCDMILIAPNHIESTSGRILNRETAKSQRAISGKYKVESGDLIYSKIRPYLKKVAIATEDCLCSADMYPIKGSNRLDVRFLFHILLGDNFTNYANDNSGRTGIPKINREELGRYSFALPPIEEQIQIARILTSMDKEIFINHMINEKHKRLQKGLMQDIFNQKVQIN